MGRRPLVDWKTVGLGERPDTEIAAELGCSVQTVGHHRRQLNKPYFGHPLTRHAGQSRRPRPTRPNVPSCETCRGEGHTADECPSPPWVLDPTFPWVVVASMKPSIDDKVFFLNNHSGIRTYPKDHIDCRCYLGMDRLPHYFPRLGVAMTWMKEHREEVVQIDVRAFHEGEFTPLMLDWDVELQGPVPPRWNPVDPLLADWEYPQEDFREGDQVELPFEQQPTA